MGHHVPAIPPPIILPSQKTEKPRWRPRIRAKAPDGAAEPHAPQEDDAVFAAGGPLDEKPPRRPGAGRAKATSGAPHRGALTAQALTDETLRTLLIVQEDILNRSG